MRNNTMHRMRISAVVLMTLIIAVIFTGVHDICAAKLDPALQKITTYKFGDSREALSDVEDIVRAAHGNENEILRLEKQFAKILTSDATYECREFICRQLRIIGTKESVPALRKLLLDEKLSDMARYALQQNLCPEAGKALRDALKKAEGNVRVGIINTLGERRDAGCVDTLIGYIEKFAKMHEGEGEDHSSSEDSGQSNEEAKKVMHEARDTAFASVNALAKIGGEKAAKILAEARHISCPKINRAAKDALLLWADNLNERGKVAK